MVSRTSEAHQKKDKKFLLNLKVEARKDKNMIMDNDLLQNWFKN